MWKPIDSCSVNVNAQGKVRACGDTAGLMQGHGVTQMGYCLHVERVMDLKESIVAAKALWPPQTSGENPFYFKLVNRHWSVKVTMKHIRTGHGEPVRALTAYFDPEMTIAAFKDQLVQELGLDKEADHTLHALQPNLGRVN